jgi:hypothetical protein
MRIEWARLRDALLVLSLLSAGCSGSGTVSGKVSYKGETLGGGTVLFYSPGKTTVKAGIAADGSYKIENIPAGPVKIAVETKSAQPPNEAGMRMGMPNIPANANLPAEANNSMYKSQGGSKGKYVEIPDELGDPETSHLTLEVTGGSQQHNIDLK